MAVSCELGKNRVVEVLEDGTMEPEVGAGKTEATGNRFLIRVAAEDLVHLRFSHAMALA